MDQHTQDQAVSRAREGYRAWEARPWHVKAWDRIRSECGYALYRLRSR